MGCLGISLCILGAIALIYEIYLIITNIVPIAISVICVFIIVKVTESILINRGFLRKKLFDILNKRSNEKNHNSSENSRNETKTIEETLENPYEEKHNFPEGSRGEEKIIEEPEIKTIEKPLVNPYPIVESNETILEKSKQAFSEEPKPERKPKTESRLVKKEKSKPRQRMSQYDLECFAKECNAYMVREERRERQEEEQREREEKE